MGRSELREPAARLAPHCAGASCGLRGPVVRSSSRLSDQIGLLVEQRHAELQKHGIEIALALADDAIELALPFVLEGAYAQCDAIGHARARRLLQQRADPKLAVALAREISRDRAPQDAA